MLTIRGIHNNKDATDEELEHIEIYIVQNDRSYDIYNDGAKLNHYLPNGR